MSHVIVSLYSWQRALIWPCWQGMSYSESTTSLKKTRTILSLHRTTTSNASFWSSDLALTKTKIQIAYLLTRSRKHHFYHRFQNRKKLSSRIARKQKIGGRNQSKISCPFFHLPCSLLAMILNWSRAAWWYSEITELPPAKAKNWPENSRYRYDWVIDLGVTSFLLVT